MALDFSIPGRQLRDLGFLYEALGRTPSLGRRLGSTRRDLSESNELRNRATPFLGGVSTGLSTLFNQISQLRRSALDPIAVNGNGVFGRRTGTAAEADVITVRVGSGAKDAVYRISTSKLAQTGRNIGTEFDGAFATRLARGQNFETITGGRNVFTITSNSTSTSVSFEVTKIGGSRTTLLEIAQAINVANVGVKAEVVSADPTVTNVRLILTATESGAAAGFTITDSAGTTIRITGADTVSLSAEDAKYVVDGKVGTGPTNTVVLQNRQVEVDLEQALDEVIVVEIGRDRAAVAAATQQFVEDFNDLLALLANGTVAQATKAKDALSGEIRKQAGELERAGITRDSTGRLSLDEETFIKARKDDIETISELLGGDDGIATSLLRSLGALPTSLVGRLQTGLGTVTGSAGTAATTGFAVDVQA